MKKLYKNWAMHNFIGHPMMQLFFMLKMDKLAVAIHNSTLPQ